MIDEQVRELIGDLRPGCDISTPGERVDHIAALDRAINMLHAALNVETAVFAEQRRLEDLADGISRGNAGRGAAIELGMARRVSKATIDHQLAFAKPLVDDFPELLAAGLDGQISQAAAKHVVRACDVLDSEQRRALDGELTDLASRLSPGQVKKAANRRVAAADPDAAVARACRARAAKNIRAVVVGDGTGTLIATLPVEQTVAAWQALDHEARCRRADGDERSIRELICDLFVERVTGRTPADDLNLELSVLISASSLLGIDEQPARLTGHHGGDYGVLPAELARCLAAGKSVWARRLVCDPYDEALLSMDTRKRRFDGALRTFLLPRRHQLPTVLRRADLRDRPGAAPRRRRTHLSRQRPRPRQDRPSDPRSPALADRASRRRRRQRLLWTTPTGHTYTSRPPPVLGYGNSRKRLRRQRTDE